MELCNRGHSYQYAVEQMLFTLFPGEKPTYPLGELSHEGSLTTTLTDTCAQAELWWKGKLYTHSQPLDTIQFDVNKAGQRAIREAFYQAGIQALGAVPPWGAITGVRPVKLPTDVLRQGGTEAEAMGKLVEGFHVSPLRAQLAVDCAKASLAVEETLTPEGISLYIGIPFCPTRCSYCSFVSAHIAGALKLVAPFLDLLCQEVAVTGDSMRRAGKTVHTLYIGGGTPTTLSAEQLEVLLTQMETHLPLEPGLEFTVEAGRPDTITAEKLAVLASHHVGRISINPQTMEPAVLKALGRTHSVDEVVDCYELARKTGEFDINMDLIAGLPEDTVEGFDRSVQALLALRPENITVHTLALKKGSTLTKQGANLPTAQAVAEMLDGAWTALSKAGYVPYYLYRQKYMSGGFENVSWCLPHKENRYNILMMEELHTVLSLGGGGITKLVDRRLGKVERYNNPKYPHDYLQNPQRILEQKTGLFQG